MSANAKRAITAIVAVAVVGIVWGCINRPEPAASAQAPASQMAKSPQAIVTEAMAQWKLRNPDRADQWVQEEKERHKIQPPADNSAILKGGQAKGQAYGNYTALDVELWNREVEKLVVEGSRIFHSADRLGGTVGVSCDMCHPDAANTHPESYPKFQPQMGRVALLRDMINWCIINPVRGPGFAADSPEMRALEAYIIAQRRGVAMEYGKH